MCFRFQALCFGMIPNSNPCAAKRSCFLQIRSLCSLEHLFWQRVVHLEHLISPRRVAIFWENGCFSIDVYIYMTFKVAVEDHEDSMFHLFNPCLGLAVCYQASRTRHASFPLLKQAYFRLTYAIWLGELWLKSPKQGPHLVGKSLPIEWMIIHPYWDTFNGYQKKSAFKDELEFKASLPADEAAVRQLRNVRWKRKVFLFNKMSWKYIVCVTFHT